MVPLRLYVEALGGAYQPVLDGRASVGIVGSLPTVPAPLTAEKLTAVGFVMVAAQDHPLAALRGPISKEQLGRHTQLVLTDRSDLSAGREFGVFSGLTWHLADLFAKHAFLLSGLGWGGMPLHTVRTDLETGKLVELKIDEVPPGGLGMQMSAVYPTASPPGPAGRWLIERLRDCQASAPPAALPSPAVQLVNPPDAGSSQPPAGKRRAK